MNGPTVWLFQSSPTEQISVLVERLRVTKYTAPDQECSCNVPGLVSLMLLLQIWAGRHNFLCSSCRSGRLYSLTSKRRNQRLPPFLLARPPCHSPAFCHTSSYLHQWMEIRLSATFGPLFYSRGVRRKDLIGGSASNPIGSSSTNRVLWVWPARHWLICFSFYWLLGEDQLQLGVLLLFKDRPIFVNLI